MDSREATESVPSPNHKPHNSRRRRRDDLDDEHEQASQLPIKKRKTSHYSTYKFAEIVTINPKALDIKSKKAPQRNTGNGTNLTSQPQTAPPANGSTLDSPASLITDYLTQFETQDLLVLYLGKSSLTEYTCDDYVRDMPPKKTKADKSQNDGKGLNEDVAPISKISDIYDNMAEKARLKSFLKAIVPFQQQGLRVVTMCSGTESPILAMQLLKEALGDDGAKFRINHLASAEIEPFKQAYIQRNFKPPLLFRDVCEFDEHGKNKPHTVNGGVADPPQDVHILVAGSSCIDYSSLNNEKSRADFNYKGQSRSTLDGVLNFVKNVRPAVVILENVRKAPWDDIREKLEQLDYFGMVMEVDSKDFYVPQTRERGYLAAFDRVRAEEIGLPLDEVKDCVVDLMQTFAQRASAPYTNFIDPDDDRELQLAQRKQNANRESRRESAWINSRHRHATYRATKELGTGRPLSRWQGNGRCQFPDFSWHGWAQSQPDRVWDLLDLKFLAFVSQSGYDMTFKHRWQDVSQTVDFNLDTRPFGIVGCVTPSGMPYDTRRGGPVFGKEVLALQAIPAEKLLLNKETSRQLQNLAGNAMTSTVVGAVLCSVIIAAMKQKALLSKEPATNDDSMFKFFPAQALLEDEMQAPQYATVEELQKTSGQWTLHHGSCDFPQNTVTLEELSKLASKTFQLCRCEGVTDIKKDSVSVCRDCGYTCCDQCKGNPSHNYKPLPPELLGIREDPKNFFYEVSKAIPPSLQIQGLTSKTPMVSALCDSATFDDAEERLQIIGLLKKCIANVFASSFRFQAVKREKMWRILYESSAGFLELQISPHPFRGLSDDPCKSVELMWLLYAKPPPTESVRSFLRETLRQPIARMTPLTSLLDRIWELRCPVRNAVDLMMEPMGVMVPAWEQKLGLQAKHFVAAEVSNKIQVQFADTTTEIVCRFLKPIVGTYKLHQECGAASGSLHSKIDDQNGMFLFLDSAPFGHASNDKFVVAHHHARLPDGVPRQIMTELDPAWKSKSTGLTTVSCPTFDAWKPYDDLYMRPKFNECKLEVLTPIFDCKPIVNSEIAVNNDCSSTSTSIIIPMPYIDFTKGPWRSGKVYNIELMDQQSALAEFQWLIKPAVSLLILEEWMRIAPEDGSFANCGCLPKLPNLEWHVASKPQSKSVVIASFEDSAEAERYEQQLMQRPLPVTAELHCGDSKSHLIIKFNLNTLTHRVLSKLSAAVMSPDVFVGWRIRVDRGLDVVASFPHIQIPTYEANEVMSPRLITNFLPSKANKLWKTQLQTLAWMQKQELGHKNWRVHEHEEAQLPALDLRVTVRGVRMVTVRGGIVADKVGAGKTITSLALAAETITDEPDSLGDGVINSGATLFLVPENIIGQWEKEMNTYLRKEVRTLVIKNVRAFKKLTWEDMIDKDIILAPWQMFLSTEYWEHMRTVVYAPNVPQRAGRGFDQWLSEAVADLGQMLRKTSSITDPENFTKSFWAARNANIEKAQEKYGRMFKGFRKDGDSEARAKDPSTVNTDPVKAGVAGAGKLIKRLDPKKQYAHEHKMDADEETLDTDHLLLMKENTTLFPLFHMFKFKRVIVDEYSYLQGQAILAILKLQSDCRWLLSATPPITDFDSINMGAKLLGTILTSFNENNGILGFARGTKTFVKDKSSAEEYRSYNERESTALRRTRYKMAQEFIAKFVRQNKALPAAGIERHKIDVYNDMSVVECLIYDKTSQHLMGAPTSWGKKKITATAARQSMVWEERLSHVLSANKKSPNVALLTCCATVLGAFFGKGNGGQRLDLSDEEIIRTFVEKKKIEFCNLAKKIQDLLQKALDCHAATPSSKQEAKAINEHFEGYFKTLVKHWHGDEAVTRFICTVLKKIKDSRQTAQTTASSVADNVVDMEDAPDSQADAEMSDPGDPSSEVEDVSVREGARTTSSAQGSTRMKLIAIDLGETTREIIQVVRELRLYHTVGEIVSERVTDLHCFYCARLYPLEDVQISRICGHIMCTGCANDPSRLSMNPGGCSYPGCNAAESEGTMKASRYKSNAVRGDLSRFGGKMSAVVARVEAILAREEQEEEKKKEEEEDEDKILVFVQHAAHGRELVEALKAKGIASTDATVGAGVSSKVQGFLKPGTTPASRVLLLKIDSEDAAGWNLQLCNHVIILSPYLATTKYDYEATMNQAVGRCLRHGQTKDVFVYQFVVNDTIEVAMVE